MREEEISHKGNYVNQMNRNQMIKCIHYSYDRIEHLEGVITKLIKKTNNGTNTGTT